MPPVASTRDLNLASQLALLPPLPYAYIMTARYFNHQGDAICPFNARSRSIQGYKGTERYLLVQLQAFDKDGLPQPSNDSQNLTVT